MGPDQNEDIQPLKLERNSPPLRSGRRWRLALSPAGLVLPLLLVAVGLYLLGPELLSRQRTTGDLAQRPASGTAEAEADSRSASLESARVGDTISFDVEEQLDQAADLLSRGYLDQAVSLFESMARQVPKDPRPEVGWARVLLMQDQIDDAVVHARRAVELEPLNAEAMTVLAQAYLAAGDTGRSLGIGQAAVELDDSSATAHATVAASYLAEGRLEEAAEEADQALEKDPENAVAHRVRAWVEFDANEDLRAALAEMRLAADLEPGVWRYHLDLGRMLLETGAYAEAIPVLEQALALRQDSRIYAVLAEAYFRLGKQAEATQNLERAQLAGADEFDLRALRAAILARQGFCQDAETNYAQVLAQEPASRLALQARHLCEGELAVPVPTTAMAATPVVVATSKVPLQGSIAFPAWNQGTQQYDIHVSQVDGTGRQLLLTGARQPAFSPDGGWLAANGERHLEENLLVLRADGSERVEVSEHAEDGLPTWSPDGLGLAFSSTQHGDRQSRIYVIDAVPLDGRKEPGRVLRAGTYDISGAYPTWTDDGQVVYKGCDYSASPAVCGLLKIPTGSGSNSPTALTANPADTAPAAFNGKVAFMSNREGNWDIYVVNDDGSGLIQLTRGSANEGLPAWAPNGRALAYVSDQGGRWAVWAMATDGSDPRQLFEIEGGGLADDWPQERISWAP